MTTLLLWILFSFIAGAAAAYAYLSRLHGRSLGRLREAVERFRGLTEREEARSLELAADKTRLRAAFDNMTEAVALMNAGGAIQELNPPMERLFGIESGRARGRPFSDVVPDEELSGLIERTLRDCSPQHGDVILPGRAGRIFEALTNPVMLKEKLGGCVVVFRDMTRRRRLEEMRREFVANVSHEMRTPLASIKGYAETLARGGIDDAENRMDFVRTIEAHADRLTCLVDDLLELAAIESGKETLRPEPAALAEMVHDVIKHLRPLAAPAGVKLVCGIGAALRVSADKAALRRVFENLLTNAIKYNREKGAVRVDARADGEKVEIRISDTGFGVPEKDLPHLFERFYRVDKARSRELGGTGLGLSIVRHIVENHGGRVWAESVEGKGTSFYFTLPFIPEK